jgi:phosphate transport system substrate-binding protein
VDFGATDAPMTDAELSKAPGKLLHIPLTLGAVVLVYNVPGVDKLKLSPQVLSGLFLGHIKAWNDPSITAINPGVPLPAEPVTIVYRSDGSGTTAVFTEYLSKVSGAWKDQVGAGKSVRFPTGLGAKGNEGVSGQVKTNPRSLGYVELAYAKQTGLRYAALQNQSGAFVEPSLDAITAAAVGAGPMPDDLRVSIVNPEGAGAYPISAFSYVLVYEEQGDFAKGKALSQFLWWASHEGQKLGPALHYAPLPQPVIRAVETKLRSMKSANGPLLAAGR